MPMGQKEAQQISLFWRELTKSLLHGRNSLKAAGAVAWTAIDYRSAGHHTSDILLRCCNRIRPLTIISADQSLTYDQRSSRRTPLARSGAYGIPTARF